MDSPRPLGYSYSRNKKIRRGTIHLGNPYATGGIAVTAAQFGLKRLDTLEIAPSHVSGWSYAWDKANGKVLAWNGTTQAGAVDLSAALARFEASGV
jgi:hypothetical protein